jgi:predicted SAM-dependent methyltransferase
MLDTSGKLYSTLRWCYQPVKAARYLTWELGRQPRKRRLLAEQNRFKGLHFGCGTFRLEGWFNCDVGGEAADFPLDITRPLDLPSDHFDVLYGSEVIEHINLLQAREFLAEALRVLKPAGVIRLTTPDAPQVCRTYLGLNRRASVANFESTWIEGEFSPEIWLNSMFNGYGHKHLYSYESLARELASVGFAQIRRCEPQRTRSGLIQLQNLERRYGENPPEFIFSTTLIVEAVKP